ncbi:hypothetical protein MSPP1_001583 [Malassezia sp. CBS 17886]|nr:hypothetical protein MSPP1_001583 [Malassezia sp. CBS 17886]
MLGRGERPLTAEELDVHHPVTNALGGAGSLLPNGLSRIPETAADTLLEQPVIDPGAMPHPQAELFGAGVSPSADPMQVSPSRLSTRSSIDSCRNHAYDSSLGPPSGALGPISGGVVGSHSTPSEALCIRVLDWNGNIAFRPASTYYRSPAALYQSFVADIEYPGGLALSGPLSGGALHGAAPALSLYPTAQWSDADYTSLEKLGQQMLLRPITPTLLRISLQELLRSLPIVQWSVVERWLSALSNPAELSQWSPGLYRQRLALLLFLCAIAASITPAVVGPVESGESLTATPWEFGHRCYRVARGLLAPSCMAPARDMQSLELVQCLILMHLSQRLNEKRDGLWLSLVTALNTAMYLINLPVTARPGAVSLEDAVIFMLEKVHRCESKEAMDLQLFAGASLPFEPPVSLLGVSSCDGPMDAFLSVEALSVFASQLDLAKILGGVLENGLVAFDPAGNPMLPGTQAPFRNTARSTKEQQRAAHMLKKDLYVERNPRVGAWSTSPVLDGKHMFVLCQNHLSQYA